MKHSFSFFSKSHFSKRALMASFLILFSGAIQAGLEFSSPLLDCDCLEDDFSEEQPATVAKEDVARKAEEERELELFKEMKEAGWFGSDSGLLRSRAFARKDEG